jgi:hypothetical protein
MHKYKRLKREAQVGVGNPIRIFSHLNVLLAFYFMLSKLGFIGFFQDFFRRIKNKKSFTTLHSFLVAFHWDQMSHEHDFSLKSKVSCLWRAFKLCIMKFWQAIVDLK